MPSTVVRGSKRAISRYSPLLSSWAVVLKILVCPYEEVSSSLETIVTHLHQYLDIVRTCSTAQEILEFHPMCSCTLWEQWIHNNWHNPLISAYGVKVNTVLRKSVWVTGGLLIPKWNDLSRGWSRIKFFRDQISFPIVQCNWFRLKVLLTYMYTVLPLIIGTEKK